MRRDKIEFTETVNANKGHTDYRKIIYHAMLRRPLPEGTDRAGSTLGRSTVGYDEAYEDLRTRMRYATGVNIGPLRDIGAGDVVLAVQAQLEWYDIALKSKDPHALANSVAALDRIRETFDILVEQRRQAQEAQDARKASTYHVWIRRTSTESAMVEVTGACGIEDAKNIALNEPNPTTDWDCVDIGDSWVTQVTDEDDNEIVTPAK